MLTNAKAKFAQKKPSFFGYFWSIPDSWAKSRKIREFWRGTNWHQSPYSTGFRVKNLTPEFAKNGKF